MDMAPADIIADITRPGYDQDYNRRQYGRADLQGRAAAFTGTGSLVELWRGSKQGTLDMDQLVSISFDTSYRPGCCFHGKAHSGDNRKPSTGTSFLLGIGLGI